MEGLLLAPNLILCTEQGHGRGEKAPVAWQKGLSPGSPYYTEPWTQNPELLSAGWVREQTLSQWYLSALHSEVTSSTPRCSYKAHRGELRARPERSLLGPGTVLPLSTPGHRQHFHQQLCNQLSFPEVPTELANKEKHLALPRIPCRCCYVYKRSTAMHTWHTPDSKLSAAHLHRALLTALPCGLYTSMHTIVTCALPVWAELNPYREPVNWRGPSPLQLYILLGLRFSLVIKLNRRGEGR